MPPPAFERGRGGRMLRLLERNVATIQDRLVLLAPSESSIPSSFNNVSADTDLHGQLVREMQRLRGAIYLGDGAIREHQLSDDGLHQTPEDQKSWHLLMLNKRQEVSACAWYLQHETNVTLEDLRVRSCPLSESPTDRDHLARAVESEIRRAGKDRLKYAEVGGWAVSKECRCTSEGLVLALAAYSLGRVCGGVLGITTATVRHSSSTILRRLGGSSLEYRGRNVPAYFDQRYDCEMELLRFDSRRPSRKYEGLVQMLQERLTDVRVIAALDEPAYRGVQPYLPQLATV